LQELEAILKEKCEECICKEQKDYNKVETVINSIKRSFINKKTKLNV
jgi:hypothetical protein